MAALSLTLLGRPQIAIDGEPIELTSQKAQALLYYLVVTGQPHARQALAGLLWSDMNEVAARRNLRVELLKLRIVVDDYLEVSRDTIGLAKGCDYTLDLNQFVACLRGHEPTFEQVAEAVKLYRGEFLTDFQIRDASLFETWVTTERERLWQMARQAMLQLVEHYTHQQAYDQGIDTVNLLLKTEPWLEDAHQQYMRLLALNGQRAAALNHYELVSTILNDEFGVPPSDETNALYDQIERGELEPSQSPLARQVTAITAVPLPPPFQAPAAPLHFVGRNAELLQLEAELQAAPSDATTNGIVALIGMAGVGKSTLAAHLGHTLRAAFPDGVLWAHAAESEPLDILGSWAQAFGYDFSSLLDVENRAAALRGVLADKKLLVILDDVRTAERCRPLLVGGASSAMLLTARHLDVAVALNAAVHTLAEMTPADGEQLLVRVLGAERVQAEPVAAREICALLQHLPLAVEIAAQQLRSRPRRRLQDMAERLQNMQARLDLAISDRAVRTSFLVSWEALDQEQRRIFALLGVFAGRSFAVDAVAAIGGLEHLAAEDQLFALTALSLLREEEGEAAQAVRYRQHPLIADFAQEQLAQVGAAGVPRLKMVRYYLAFAQEHQTNYTVLQPEWANLIAGMRQAHALAEWQMVLDYADTLTEPWFTRARYTEAREAYGWAKEAAETLGDQNALGEALLHWGHACFEQYDYDEAELLLLGSEKIFGELKSSAGTANVSYHRARVAIELADYEAAETLLSNSLHLCEQLDDESTTAAVIDQQALIAYRRGIYDQAMVLCQQALATHQRAGDKSGMLPTLRLLADLAVEAHEYEAAEVYFKDALVICQEAQNSAELAATHYGLAFVSRLRREFATAQHYAEEALVLCQRSGNRGCHAATLYELSRIYNEQHEYALAIEVGEQSLRLLQTSRDRFNMIHLLRHLGEVQMNVGNHKEAITLWQRALGLAKINEHPLTERIEQHLHDILHVPQTRLDENGAQV